MILFNPSNYRREHADTHSRELVEKTIAFFENKGLAKIKEDDQAMVWYDDFLEFIKDEKIFASLLTRQFTHSQDRCFTYLPTYFPTYVLACLLLPT